MDILLEAVADLGLEITEIAGVTIIDDYFKNKYFVNSNNPNSIRFTPNYESYFNSLIIKM